MINFLKYRKLTALSSLALIVAFGGVAIYRQQTRGSVYTYSVDFTGGTQVLFAFDQAVDAAQIKQIVAGSGWVNASIREFGKNEIMVRVAEFEGDTIGLGERMKLAIQQALPGNGVHILQTESVGAGVGADLRSKSARAIFVAMILMLFYIATRFWSFAFAAGAILALSPLKSHRRRRGRPSSRSVATKKLANRSMSSSMTASR